ncbi:MAG: hypothetical protein ACE5GS_02100 [Kiloniellaceae bacterium]
MRVRPILFVPAFALLTGLMMTACDESEQGRVLRYEKGTYLGPKDQPLTEDVREDLRQRTRLQRGG